MINDNYKNFNDINFDISINECFQQLIPHPKFKDCTFENYMDDKNYPSQAMLKDRLMEISMSEKKKAKFSLFKKKKTKISKNIYIDGKYGIGKTHLLSACFNMFKGTKAFMSFLELTYFINFLGLDKTIEHFKNIDLLLLDEFDLDDPATTRMVARFIDSINEETTIVTTSNRLPRELGGGKFDVTMFEKELGIISKTFDVVTIEGKSFRINLGAWKAIYINEKFDELFKNYESNKHKTITDYSNLIEKLRENHPFKFFVIPKECDAVFIDKFQPIQNINDAIRFAIFIDYCYYHNTKLFFRGSLKDNIFPDEIMNTSFKRLFLRCNSRLDELAVFLNN